VATNGYQIEVSFMGGLSPGQEGAFASAANRWSQIVAADVPPVEVNGQRIDDCLILAEGTTIDGPEGVLGQAGPQRWRQDSMLPALGFMQFDSADLLRMETDGSLESVIFHEMGHVLGMGTLWELMGLLDGAGTVNPVFTGSNAMREFGDLIGANEPTPVPVENKGGPGTRDGHWRESVLGAELMTGFLGAAPNPVSRVTIAAMQDMGYEVDFDAADEFLLPSPFELALIGIGAIVHPQGCMTAGMVRRGATPKELPKEAELAA
jgi:Leishmanolysin